MRLITGAATDVGRVREGNEDAYLVDDAMGLVAVADGMGGHRAGEVASATALEALRSAITHGRPLRESMEDANEAVFTKSLTDEELRGMGTTLTAATLVTGGTVLVGHVGDSRAYLLHDGELRQVTVDHSLVEELVREGRLTADEAAVHPQRSIITRALGVDASVEVDVYPVELAPGDRLLLCSDGLTGMVQAETIAATLRREEDPARAAAALIDAANVAGGEDNITAVVVAVTDDPPLRAVSEPVAPIEATVVEEEPAPDAGERRRRGARGVGRVLLWALPIVVVLGVAVGAVGWYARRSYFVDLHQGRVTVFKGVPGGLAGWDPTIERRTAIAADQLRPADLAAVKDREKFSSLDDANAFVARIRANTTTTTTTTPPTTTVPGATTSAPPTTPTTLAPAP
ncbi:MAG TPA: Stp1/IreP family PP2C-type Ser/Thr phosphatase [Acidimicrobiia bacterium]|jgi:protein phosphatase|nr:Stp1/IreP family PP2C-type Ser/Thr phosphatase [Acidimicrobiia bacterium]